MRIAFIVDGQTEYSCLLRILRQSGTPNELISIKFCDLQPYSSIKQIAYKVERIIPGIRNKKPNLIVVLIDIENRVSCPPQFASELQKEIEKRLPDKPFSIAVIIKVRCFENWLIADLDAVSSLAQFTVSKNIRRQIEPNKADNIDAIKLIKQIGDGGYDKFGDGIRLSKVVTPKKIALHSRSFRKCLKVIGVQQFIKQSKKPLKNY